MKTKILVVVAASSFALLVGFFAYAASNGVITACVSKMTGIMRIPLTGSCKSFENALTWNGQGPAGEQGEQGPPGPKGDKGDAGLPGPSLTQEDFYHVEGPMISVQRGSGVTTGIGCEDENDIAISGGYDHFDCGTLDWRTISNRPNPWSLDSWHVEVALEQCPNVEGRIKVHAICLRVPGP